MTDNSSRRRRLAVAVFASCLAALFVACGSGGQGKKDVVIEGDTARVRMVIHHGAPFLDNVKVTASNVAERVYEVAKANPEVKKVEVTLVMSKQGLEDRHGNPWPEDREMGVLTVADLDDVRKFVDAGHYATNDRVRASYSARIRAMKHAEVLGK